MTTLYRCPECGEDHEDFETHEVVRPIHKNFDHVGLCPVTNNLVSIMRIYTAAVPYRGGRGPAPVPLRVEDARLTVGGVEAAGFEETK